MHSKWRSAEVKAEGWEIHFLVQLHWIFLPGRVCVWVGVGWIVELHSEWGEGRTAYSMGYTVIHSSVERNLAWQAMEFSFPPPHCNRLSCRLQTEHKAQCRRCPRARYIDHIHTHGRPEILWSKWNHLMNSYCVTRGFSVGLYFSIILQLHGGGDWRGTRGVKRTAAPVDGYLSWVSPGD